MWFDVTNLLEEIKRSPYEEQEICSPHTGVVQFAEGVAPGVRVEGPDSGVWPEKRGTLLLTIERERNVKSIHAPRKGEIVAVSEQCGGRFVEAGEPLLRIRHYLSRDEVIDILLKRALYQFVAPERAKYYFLPELDLKIKASGSRSVKLRDGDEVFIMSRMKREAVLPYRGPEGVIYAVYFQPNEIVDADRALIGVCPPDQLPLIQDVVARVHLEWSEQE